MHMGARPLPQRHRAFHTRNAEEARAYLQSVDLRLELDPRHASEIDLRLKGFYLADSYIGRVKYGPAVTVVAADRDRDDFWLHLPLRGAFEVTNRAGSVACASGQDGVLSGPAGHVTRSQAGSERVTLAIVRSAMEHQLAMLLGEPTVRALEFAPKVNLTSSHGRTLAGYLHLTVADMERPGSMLHQAAALGEFEHFIMTVLLLSHSHNYSEALRHHGRPIAPRDVRRAVDYIEAHLTTRFTISDIVEATGVAGRTLFKHFKDFKGVSPMRYALNARFLQVRQALQRAEPEESVTDIALRWGFTHLGRFSVEYRRRFGESPSQTLGRRRTRSSG